MCTYMYVLSFKTNPLHIPWNPWNPWRPTWIFSFSWKLLLPTCGGGAVWRRAESMRSTSMGLMIDWEVDLFHRNTDVCMCVGKDVYLMCFPCGAIRWSYVGRALQLMILWMEEILHQITHGPPLPVLLLYFNCPYPCWHFGLCLSMLKPMLRPLP